MNFACCTVILFSLVLILNSEKASVHATNPWNFVHDLLQYNVAGAPIIHEKTEWNFDPELGKKRRARYEAENGRHGEIAIAKLGMGIGYEGAWGTPVKKRNT